MVIRGLETFRGNYWVTRDPGIFYHKIKIILLLILLRLKVLKLSKNMSSFKVIILRFVWVKLGQLKLKFAIVIYLKFG